MKTVVFCVPGKSFTNKFLSSWTNLMASCQDKINFEYRFFYSPNIYYSRNGCLEGDNNKSINQKPFQGKLEYDYIMWIDSDMVFEPKDFWSLFNKMEDKPNIKILSGLYLKAHGIEYAVVKSWGKSGGAINFLKPSDIKTKKDVIKVEMSGLGFTLVRNGVFEQLKFPWLKPLKISNKQAHESFTMDDVSFGHLTQKLGINTYIDPSVRVGHEKMTVLT